MIAIPACISVVEACMQRWHQRLDSPQDNIGTKRPGSPQKLQQVGDRGVVHAARGDDDDGDELRANCMIMRD